MYKSTAEQDCLMGGLTRILENEGPTAFTVEDINAEEDLFSHRAALYYTPSENLPSEWIGTGSLDVILPIPTPAFFESLQSRQSPKVWVDLLQRATNKLRWTPAETARVRTIRYDVCELNYLGIGGAKALIDALKRNTYGRPDGWLLHYFGAIVDDDQRSIKDLKFDQEYVKHPADAKTRVIVEPL